MKILFGIRFFSADSTKIKSLDIESLINKKPFPIRLIWGKEDQTSLRSEQIEPLRVLLNRKEFSNFFQENSIENAGHALHWTHAKEVSQIMMEVL